MVTPKKQVIEVKSKAMKALNSVTNSSGKTAIKIPASGAQNENQEADLLDILKNRFHKNMSRHKSKRWTQVEKKIVSNAQILKVLLQMEMTGGEPDVVELSHSSSIVFVDCSPETPKGRCSLCYDGPALESRKEHKPRSSALEEAERIGIELLSEEQYQALQQFGPFDTKTSSWLNSPPEIRALGGAIFGDHRFGRVFVYHNGAESYYSGRGFRGILVL